MELEERFRRPHRYAVSKDETKENQHEKTRSNIFLIILMGAAHGLVLKVEKALNRLGAAVYKKGRLAFGTTFVIMTLLCLGYMRSQKTDWAPQGFQCHTNQARNDLGDAAKIFPNLDAWKSEVIFTNGVSENVLDSDCLIAASSFVRTIDKTSVAFKRNCALCQLPTLSDFYQLNNESLLRIDDCQRTCTLEKLLVSDTVTLSKVRVHKVNYNQSNLSANGIIVTFHLKRPIDYREKTLFHTFEKDLTLTLRQLSSRYTCRMVLRLDKNEEDKVWLTVTPSRQLLLYALPAILFVCLELIFYVFTRSVFLMIAIFVVSTNTVFCASVAFGFLSILSIPYHDFYLIVPLYGYCQCLVLCLPLVNSINATSSWNSINRQVKECMTKAGFVVTVTALVVIVLNGIAAWSCIIAITRFMVFLFLLILLNFVSLFLTVFPILVWLSEYLRSGAKRNRGLSCSRGFRQGLRKWTKALSSLTGKIIVLGFILSIVGGCITYICVVRPPAFNDRRLTDLYDKHVKEASSSQVVSLIVRNVDYTNNELRKSLADFVKMLSSASYSAGKPRSWISSFELWRKSENRNCTGSEFKVCLQIFFNTSKASFEYDIKIENGRLTESRIQLPVNQITLSTKMDLENKLLQHATLKDNIIAVSSDFAALKDTETFMSGLLRTIPISLLLVVICLLFIEASFLVPFILLFSFLLLGLELATLLCLFDVPFNQLTFICVFPTLVTAFSWSVFVGQTFLTLNIGSGRTLRTIASTFVPVFSSALAQIACSLVLGSIFTYLDLVFIQVLPILYVFGLLNAMMIIPTLLSTFEMQHQRFRVPPIFARRFLDARSDGFAKARRKARTGQIPLKTTAIIGIGCRFPLAQNKDEFWEVLKRGGCLASDFPQNRKSEYEEFHSVYHPKQFVPGRICTTAGTYLENIKGFDAAFFNISHQEANSMDPQQRLLLEVVYEAIEDSGMTIEDLQACRTGVFVGAKTQDYGHLVVSEDNKTNLDQFAATGTARTIIANRISFCFNFTGPSFIVDTACSSSLIALRLAIESLENGDCEAAVVCASNIILCHLNHMVSSLAGLLAPDGRCKSFDVSGDGYGRGEGFAAVILKLKDTAVNDGDDIYSEIVSCGMNSDGSQAVPMTAPSVQGQAELARFVLQKSGLQAEDIDYIEAHGTGTAIGDVVEVSALSKAYCESTNDNQRILRIGSVKSNINHTESTSGLAGVIKLALMIKNGHYVPTVNVKTVNPALKLQERGIIVQTIAEEWERRNGKPRIGAVSSYGFGGSNAHAILREFTPSESSHSVEQAKGTHVMTLSAKADESLCKAAQTLSTWISENKDQRMDDVCFSLNERRTVHPNRMAFAFETTDEAIKLLNNFGADTDNWKADVSSAIAKDGKKRIVFMFAGQGPQWYGMAKELIEKEPSFLSTIKEICNLLWDMGEQWDLLEELTATEEKSRLDEVVIGQTATFALEYGIARLLISWGIRPSAVVGHSLGELAAAAICGDLPLRKALSIVVLRASLQAKCRESGVMVAVGMSQEQANSLLCELNLDMTVNVAAVNDAQSVTLSGDRQSMEAFKKHLELNDIKCDWKELNTARAFHSSHMAPIEKEFKQKIAKMHLTPSETNITFYSTVRGKEVPGRLLSDEYWWSNIRQPVLFNDATKAILQDGYRDIIEVGAQPALAHYVKKIAAQMQMNGDNVPHVIPTLPSKRVSSQHKAFLKNTVCSLFVSGYPVLFSRVFPRSAQPRFIRLPSYTWHEKEYWYRSKDPDKMILPLNVRPSETVSHGHPFLFKTVKTRPFLGLSCWDVEIDTYHLPFLKDHTLTHGGTIMPATAYIEMAFAMAKETFLGSFLELRDVEIKTVLTLPEGQIRNLRLRLEKQGHAGEAEYQITSVQEDQTEVVLSVGRVTCDGQLESQAAFTSEPTIGNAFKVKIDKMEEYPVEQFLNLRSRLGFSFGPAFSLIKRIWKSNEETLCLAELDQVGDQSSYVVHPCIIDACLQATIPSKESSLPSSPSLPAGMESVTAICTRVPRQVLCHVKRNLSGLFDITQMNLEGKPFLQIKGLKSEAISPSGKDRNFTLDNVCYNVTWEQTKFSESTKMTLEDVVCVVLKDSRGYADAFVSALRGKGANVVVADLPESQNFQNEAEEKKVEEAILNGIDISKKEKKTLKVVTFWPVQAQLLAETYENIDQIENLALRGSFCLIQLMMNANLENGLVMMVTAGSQFISNEHNSRVDSMPWSAMVLGMRRSAAIEATEALDLKVVDLSCHVPKAEINALINELTTEDREMEVAYRGDRRYVNRFVRLSAEDVLGDVASNFTSGQTRDVYLTKKNDQNNCLELKELTRSIIQEGEVEIEAMILYSSEGQIHEFASNSGCIAFSGLVTEVGSRRSRFKPSNKVCGIITPCRVGEKIRVKEVHLLIQPEVFTEVQAAAFPYCIVIACKVLDRSLSGKTSPTVLIHEAQTGLGYTTAAIAAAMGHKTVCSTTQLGNESTRRILQNAGIEGIVDVSCLDLEDECKAKFDAVLFLSSPKPGAMKRSLSSLKHDGKLVVACEDFTGQAILSGRSSICYDRIRPSELLMGTNESFEEMWLSCQSMLMRTGVLQKLLVVPQETTSVYRAVKKWNSEEKWPQQEKRSTIYRMFMFDKNERPCAQIPGLDIFGLKRDRTYMVAGGVRGFGFQLAQSFAENGAKTVVLLARSPPSEEKKKVVQEIERRTGARMIMEQVDLSSETQMKTLELKLKGLPSMAGIVHTAVVLHDAFVHNMELDSFKKVLAPKLRGAFLLHKMSLQMDLDFFVLFSSLASVMGGRGQSAYSAANAFLDSLAGYRRHTLGLPGLAINWGPIGGAGILTRELKIANLHAEYGFGLLDAELGSKFLIEILKCQPSRCQVTLAEIDWVQFFKTSDESARSTRVKSLRSEVEDKSERHTDETASLASRILFQTDTTKREHLIEEFVMSTLARCFELDSFSEADRTTSLYAFGADSITALTLKAAFETSLQMSFEVFYFLQPEISAVKIVRDLQEMMSNPENQQEIQQQQHTAFVKTIEQEDTTLMSPLSFNDSSNGANDSEKDTVKVVPIYAPEDAEVKFFCIHPSHRYVMSVAPFASGFRSQTLVAMYSIGFTEPVYHGADCSSVRELASHYVSLVREEQKHGPYFLGGYCFGGLVAYEMACILTEQGESVGFVGMIDTYVWLPPSGGFGRFSSYFLQDFDPEKQVEIRMESYLSRIAINNLAMKEEEYQRMRAEHSISDVMDLLQQRSCDLDKPLYNLKDMRDNLHHDIVTSRKRQDEWEPAKVQYEGPVLYIRCEDPKYCPVLWHYKSSDRAWEDVLPGPVDVCMCPGDHFSLGLLPEARPVGMIMVNSISFRYRTLFPELYPLELDYKHRRAIRTYLGGIPVVLYGENGKGCKTGKVSLKREKQELCFMSSSRRSRNIGIPLKDVRSVLPGKYVTHATRKWARKSLDHLLQDLGNVVSVFANRTYDFQFSSIEDTQMFVLLTEALFNVNIADMF